MLVKLINWIVDEPAEKTDDECFKFPDNFKGADLPIPVYGDVSLNVRLLKNSEIWQTGFHEILSYPEESEKTETHVLFNIPQYSKEATLTLLHASNATIIACHGRPVSPFNLRIDFESGFPTKAQYVAVLLPELTDTNPPFHH